MTNAPYDQREMGAPYLISQVSRSNARVAAALLVAVAVFTGCQEHVFHNPWGDEQIAVPDDLYAVTAIGSDHVWAAGYFGAVYHTADRGQTWRKLNSGTEKSLYDISFADEKNGWVVGRRGLILNTKDGGESWQKQKGPRFPARHIFSVHAVSGEVAWAVGDWGSRYRTRDGGETWEDLSLLVDDTMPTFKYLSDEDIATYQAGGKVYDDTYLNDVFFFTEQEGWIAAEYGIILRTSDGGETWERGTVIGKNKFDSLEFAAGESKVSREQWPGLFKMAEVLVDAQHLRVRIEGFVTEAEIKAADGDTSLADDRAQAIADFLESEGVNQDRLRVKNPTPFDQESVDMDAFRLTKLADQGRAVPNVLETPFLFDVKFTDAQNGIVAGLGGVILQTADAGKTWEYRDSDSRLPLFGIGVGESAAFAVGDRGLNRRSTDGGLTWAAGDQHFQDEFGIYRFMRDISFGDPKTGWIVGAAGKILRSTDGGMNWELIDVQKRSAPAQAGVGAGE